MTDRTSTPPSLSLARHDANSSSELFSEPFFRRIAELAMSALDVPIVALKFTVPETIWVATQDDGYDSAALSAQLQESTLFRRISRSGDVVIDDVWTQEQFAALVDLEQFAYRFVASVALTDGEGRPVGSLCVLDRRARSLADPHRDVLRTLAEMARSEVKRQQEAARRRRGDALRDRLQRVLQMISRDEPVEVTLEALMYLVETQLPGFAATMHWLDPEGLLRPVAAPSVPHALIEATDGLPADAEAGSIGASVHDGEEVLDTDIAEHMYWNDLRAAVETAGFRASWSFPVRSSEGRAVLGAVTLFSETPLTPTDEMRQTVEIAAQIAAVALERDRDRSMLERTQVRHQRFLSQCGEGMYRIAFDPVVAVDQPIEVQIKQVFERAHIAECNDAFARQHGFSEAADLLGRPLLDLYGEGQDLAQLPVLRAVDHGYVLEDIESCEVDQQGRQRWFLNNLRGVVEDGALVAFWGAQQDVTKQKHTEYALRESEHRYHTLVDLVPNLVMVHDEDEIQCVNSTGARLLGATDSDALQGCPLSDIIRDDERREQLLRRARQIEATHAPEYLEYEITGLDGTSRSVEMVSCHVLHRGNPVFLSVARGAERRVLDAGEERSRAEAVSHLQSVLIANMDREIRTPLTAMIGFAELLDDAVADPHAIDLREIIDHIRSNGQRLLWTFDSIVNLSRMEAGTFELHPKPFDVVKEIGHLADTFRVMAREKGVVLDVQAEQPEIHASLDRVAFGRVVGNLLANAVREAEDGTVTLRARKSVRGAEVAVEHASDGRGPHRHDMTAVDEVDASFDDRVGMAAVKNLVELMGGDFEVAARPDGGTVYTAHFGSADDVTLRQALHLLPEHAASAA